MSNDNDRGEIGITPAPAETPPDPKATEALTALMELTKALKLVEAG